ncbi:MAG: hypothetical protein K6G44_17395 [Lentisphaeria bacterium]|nr:hypothetical protein [Lentisphaeria bacterium]
MPSQAVWRTALAWMAAPGNRADVAAMGRRREDVSARGAVFQTGYLASDASPALKGGVTTNNALQAGCIFQMCN